MHIRSFLILAATSASVAQAGPQRKITVKPGLVQLGWSFLTGRHWTEWDSRNDKEEYGQEEDDFFAELPKNNGIFGRVSNTLSSFFPSQTQQGQTPPARPPTRRQRTPRHAPVTRSVKTSSKAQAETHADTQANTKAQAETHTNAQVTSKAQAKAPTEVHVETSKVTSATRLVSPANNFNSTEDRAAQDAFFDEMMSNQQQLNKGVLKTVDSEHDRKVRNTIDDMLSEFMEDETPIGYLDEEPQKAEAMQTGAEVSESNQVEESKVELPTILTPEEVEHNNEVIFQLANSEEKTPEQVNAAIDKMVLTEQQATMLKTIAASDPAACVNVMVKELLGHLKLRSRTIRKFRTRKVPLKVANANSDTMEIVERVGRKRKASDSSRTTQEQQQPSKVAKTEDKE